MATTSITGCIIAPCTCAHPAQDRMYGAGQRVHNLGPKSAPSKGAGMCCTVCGKDKPR